jgi:hypothetical protein
LQRRKARKIVAHSASCGWRIRAVFFQPRRGERMCRRFLSPLWGSGRTRRMPLFPQLALWATIFRPLRGLISVTNYRECFDRLETLCRMSNSYNTHHGRFKAAFPFRTAPVNCLLIPYQHGPIPLIPRCVFPDRRASLCASPRFFDGLSLFVGNLVSGHH